MIPLPKQFRRDKFDYEQVFRQGQIAIYRQTKPGQAGEHFEVGKIRQNKARHQFGTDIPARESWPNSEEWGVRAYTYTDFRHAKARALAMIPPNA